MAITRTDQLSRQIEHAAVIAHGAHPEYRLEFPAEVDGTVSGFDKIYQGSVVSLNASGKYVIGCAAGTGVNYPVPCISLKNVFDPDVTTGKLGTSAFASITVSSNVYYRLTALDTAVGATAYYGWKNGADNVLYTQSETPVTGTTTYAIAGGTASAGSTVSTAANIQVTDYRKTTYSAVGGKITAIPCTGGYEIETTEFDTEAEYAPNDVLVAGTSTYAGKVVKGTASTADIGTAPVIGFVSRAKFKVESYGQDRISFWTNFIPVSHA